MFWGNQRIYLDYASSTLPLKEALSAMRTAEHLIGNPGGIHTEALAARQALDAARDSVAHELACKGREIIFTSGLTEAINLAILGYAKGRTMSLKGRRTSLETLAPLTETHWIVSSIEHSAVLECFAEVERLGGVVTYLDPNEKGIFAVDTVVNALRPETVFISIGWANNEIGVVQPIRDISRAVQAHNEHIVFHSDAGQAPLYLSPHVHTLGVDLLSLGSNKLYGPHGVGALYVSSRTELAPIIHGGGQERSLRSGTENVALAAGFAAAFATVSRERSGEVKRLRELRDSFARDLESCIPGIILNTDVRHSLPHILNISLPSMESEYVAIALDQAGIAVSTKSACAEGGTKVSHVVAALRGDVWRSERTVRFSLGRSTRARDLTKTKDTLLTILAKSKG